MNRLNRLLNLIYRDLRIQFTISTVAWTLLSPIAFIFFTGMMMGALVQSVSINGQSVTYLAFLIPGIIAEQVLSGGLMAGWTVVADRREGDLEQILSMPFTRLDYIAAMLISMILFTLMYVSVVVVLASAISAINISLMAVLMMLVYLVAGTLIFGSIMLMIVTISRSYTAINIAGAFIASILIFASSVYYPINANTPVVLSYIAYSNPLTYIVNGIRQAFFGGLDTTSLFVMGLLVLLSFAIMTVVTLFYERSKTLL